MREWRVNLVSNYGFTEGALRGFNIGGVVRWQDRVAIGYDVTSLTNPDGSPFDEDDIGKPYFGPSEANLDVWIGYGRKVHGDRVDWRVQLNVRNPGTGAELIPVVAQPDGSVAAWGIADPVRVALTNSFRFRSTRHLRFSACRLHGRVFPASAGRGLLSRHATDDGFVELTIPCARLDASL